MVGSVIVRSQVGLERLRSNNEVAGFKFATVGVIYAVLLGFAVIVVWEKFSDSERHVAEEAGAVATIYRLSKGIEGETGIQVREAITGYVRTAITKDWPAMANGGASRDVDRALDDAYAAVLSFYPGDRREGALLSELFRQLDLVTQARRSRLAMASGIVPGVIWIVLFGGAAITLGFTFFFGTENLRAQLTMTGALSLLIFSAILTIIAIDHPFAGTVKVGPQALTTVLKDLGASLRP